MKMSEVICFNCLTNEGLRRELIGMDLPTLTSACPNCQVVGGGRIDEPVAKEIFWRFFCDGSCAAAYLPRVFTSGPDEGDDLEFEVTANSDYELLKRKFGFLLHRHTPRLYELGITSIRSHIDDLTSQDAMLAAESDVQQLRTHMAMLLDAATISRFDANCTLYRARIRPKEPVNPKEYDSPPPEIASANRVAFARQPVLCAALDIETCLIETRPHIDDLIHHRVFVASLIPKDVIKVLDFTKFAEGTNSEIRMTLEAFFEANDSSYHLTQLLSGFAQRRGYDGICYPSAMECITDERNQWKNLALFGSPIRDGKLLVKSINRVLVKDVAYSYALGPAWKEETEGNSLAPYLKGWIKRAQWIPPAE